MKTFVKHAKIGTIKSTSNDGKVTWFYARNLYVGWENPLKRKMLSKPWFSIVPAGGFHFLGLRVTWFTGSELKNKRISNY